MKALISILVGLAVFAGVTGAWWRWGPPLEVEARVMTKLADQRPSRFSSVTYNRATAAGCGFVDVASGRTHFVLMPDGTLQLDPRDRLQGGTLQQLEALRRHADYLALVYAQCA